MRTKGDRRTHDLLEIVREKEYLGAWLCVRATAASQDTGVCNGLMKKYVGES